MRVTIIQNPKSGSETLTGAELVSAVAQQGHQTAYASTDDPDAVSARLHDPGDLVVVAGGDGTLRDVANRLIGRNVPIAPIPTGTANNIARTLGLEGHARELIARWPQATRVAFDTCLVRGAGAPRAMFEGAGIGPMAVTIAALSPLTSNEARAEWTEDEVRRDLKVLREIAVDHPCYDCDISLDGHDLSGRYFVVEIMNIRSVGPNVEFAPHADVSDGQFDVILLGDDERHAFVEYLNARIEGRPVPMRASARRGCALRLAWRGSRVHIDDQVWPAEPFVPRRERDEQTTVELEVLVNPNPLEFVVPA